MKIFALTELRSTRRYLVRVMLCCLSAFVCCQTVQAAQPVRVINPTLKRNMCELWFEQVWPQLSLTGQLPAQPKVPPKCRANPWVQWIVKQQAATNLSPSPSKPTYGELNDPFFTSLNKLQQAVTWGEQGRLREAYDLLRKLAKEQPEWPEIYYNIGIIQELRGELSQSRASFEYALDLCSFSPCRIPREATEQHIEQLGLFLKVTTP